MPGHISKGNKRKDGSTVWRARLPDKDRPGTTYQIERSFRTKQEAQDWLTEQQHALNQGTYISPQTAKRPFQDVLTAWEETWSALSPTTRARYDQIVRNYLTPTFGNQPIASITHERVQRYVNQLTQDPKNKPGTVRNIFACLRNACTRAVRMNLMRVNPCQHVVLPRSPKEEQIFLTPQEITALANQIDEHYRLPTLLAAYTGLRAGELWALQRGDVALPPAGKPTAPASNPAPAKLHVRRTAYQVSGQITTGPPKTPHSRRTIFLPAFLTEQLRAHLKTLPLNPDALLFPAKRDPAKPVRHNLFYRRHFRPAATTPNVLPPDKQGVRFHDLRHTAASLMIASGAHAKLVSAAMGHSSINITYDRYGHLLPGIAESVAENLDALYADAQASAQANAKPDVLQLSQGQPSS